MYEGAALEIGGEMVPRRDVWFVRDCFVFFLRCIGFWLFYPFRSSCTSVKEFVPDLRAILLCFTCRLGFLFSRLLLWVPAPALLGK
jgi:hypothetical protein